MPRDLACAGTTSASSKTDTIDFVTVSSTGNAMTFGNFHFLLGTSIWNK